MSTSYYPKDLSPEEINEFESEYDQWIDDQRKHSATVDHMFKPKTEDDHYRRYEGRDYWED